MRGFGTAACLLLTAGLAACSSPVASSAGGSGHAKASGSSSAPAASASAHAKAKLAAKGKSIPGLISFRGTLHITGARKRQMSFTAFPGVTSPASSCARLAAKGTPVPAKEKLQFEIPSPSAGSENYFMADVLPYRGPGTYTKSSIVSVGTGFMIGDVGFNPLATAAVASVTFRADGSGTFTFSHAKAIKPGKGAISGSISWTCSG